MERPEPNYISSPFSAPRAKGGPLKVSLCCWLPALLAGCDVTIPNNITITVKGLEPVEPISEHVKCFEWVKGHFTEPTAGLFAMMCNPPAQKQQ